MVLCKVKLTDIILALMAAFYVFNVHYTPGCSNIYAFLDAYYLSIKPSKKTKLASFMAQFSSTVL